uniref:Variable lymphocyte receptor A cassette n=2 Tax=Petromyzon marinus TaxID=7757 RepID=S4S0Z9_PETMA
PGKSLDSVPSGIPADTEKLDLRSTGLAILSE